MLENFWHKKEKPIQGLMGLGGGAAGHLMSGAAGGDGHTATGGIISEYSDGATIYRAHIFVSDGTFTVTSVDPNPDYATIDLLVVGGGGSGSGSIQNYWAGAGGGVGRRSGSDLFFS